MMWPIDEEVTREMNKIALKELLGWAMIAVFVASCALTIFMCNRGDEMKKVKGVVYGHAQQFKMIDKQIKED